MQKHMILFGHKSMGFQGRAGSPLTKARIRLCRSEQNGMTLVEVLLTIVLLGIAIPPLLMVFAENAVTAAKAAKLPTANVLANGLMEEIRSRKFDELSAKIASGNWSGVMGVDAGESAGNKTTFDDVDDFNGWAQSFTGFTDYTASVTVRYVSGSDLNTPLTIPSPMTNNWTPSYKRIQVTVSNTAIAASITLTTVVTEVQSL